MSPRNVVDSRSRTSYEVVKRLGKGAFATCYLVSARQRAHPNVQCYALKKFPRKAADDDQRFVKICNEVAVHGRLCSGSCHPNVVGMLTAFDSEEGDVCMLLEYCANGNLADFVERTEEIIRYGGHSFASDYWAVACTFFFMLSGVTPFQTSTIKSTYSKICRSDYHYPANFTGGPKAKDFIARVLCVEPVHRMSMREMLLHPLFQSFRRSSMSNLLTDSNGNIVEPPVKPLSRCQSVFDFNSTRSTPDPEHQLMSTYSLFYRALQSVFTPSDYSEFSLLPIDRPLPETFVVKWVDYTNKFGFGAMLKNGVRSVCFNDESILSTIDCDTFVYHPLRTHRGCTIWDFNTLLCPAFQSKIQTARYVRSYMDQELTSSVRLEDPDDFLMVELCRSTYLMEVIKMDEMIVFLISDGSMQINFTSTRLKVLLQREHDSLYLYAVTAQGLTSYLLDDYARSSDVQPPQWTPCVMDAIHSVIQRRSVARRSTKC
ncbi:Serine/threonine-protein kinase PLK [Aphelenchoides fujianensis]|nr:Serine/threonine-protein kinase PLK [Aphelenchoides fujianensis]